MTGYWIILILICSLIVAFITLIITGGEEQATGNKESSILQSLIWPVTLILAVVAGIFGTVTAIVANILGLIKLGIDKLK